MDLKYSKAEVVGIPTNGNAIIKITRPTGGTFTFSIKVVSVHCPTLGKLRWNCTKIHRSMEISSNYRSGDMDLINQVLFTLEP